jgi:hypothetical protein
MSWQGDLLKGGIDQESAEIVGYKIVPISVVVDFAQVAVSEATIFVAPFPVQVTNIYYTPNVIGSDSGAVTATIVKATAAVIPAKGTTPMHVASAIDLKGTVHTVQTITLSTTTADLKLVAGERIGYDTTGTLTAAEGTFTIMCKTI